ncbi:MAG TPA: type II toxin-antitoxin system VapC family toxin [Pirellulales bacterium]
MPALLDTDVLSEVLKGRHRRILEMAAAYTREHQRFTLSAITLYEIERGLLAKQATRLLMRLDAITEDSTVLSISLSVLRRAARLWAEARAAGRPRNDADLLIAATALEHDLALVTGNQRHFGWIPRLRLEAWA